VKFIFKTIFSLVIGFGLISCAGPRSQLNSGKVLSKNQVRFGKNYTINISTAPVVESVKGTVALAENLRDKDTVIINQQITSLNRAFLAYCLDPIGYNAEIFFRYGIGHRIDFGFKNCGGSNSFDVQYQFLGSNKNFNESEKGGWYGSISAQFGWKNYRFVNWKMFTKFQRLFGLEMKRQDISVPVIFSKSWGPEERVGCFSFGIVYTHSFIKYKFNNERIYSLADSLAPSGLLVPVEGKTNFSSYGTFMNLKVGKKFVYFNFSLAVYYQNYGTYQLLGGKKALLEGLSIVPSYGIQINIYKKSKGNNKTVQPKGTVI
jgi:hypothetical protein